MLSRRRVPEKVVELAYYVELVEGEADELGSAEVESWKTSIRLKLKRLIRNRLSLLN